MSNLIFPDILEIQFYDKTNKPLHQANILIGIRTFATYKNDIDISPFLSDDSGKVTIKKDELINAVDDFISYGIMDYGSIESAKPDIEIYFWGRNRIERILYSRQIKIENGKTFRDSEIWSALSQYQKDDLYASEKRSNERYDKFEKCFNRKTKIKEDITLIKDSWIGREYLRMYNATIDL